MVKIRFELGYQRIESSMCYLAVEMVFNRYEGQANERCVFTEHSSTSGMGVAKSNVDEWIKIYERTKSAIWGRGLSKYLGADARSRETGGQFDLAPYHIRIKTKAADSELPNLEFDISKRELSFEWEGMFDRFFREWTVLSNAKLEIMKEGLRWHEAGGNCAMVGNLAHTTDRVYALQIVERTVRRRRVEKFYADRHNFEFMDSMFDKMNEEKVFTAIREYERYGDFTRCAEGSELRKKVEAPSGPKGTLKIMETTRRAKGVREDNETDNEYDDEDGGDVSEEDYAVDDEWAEYYEESENEESDDDQGDLVASNATGAT